MLFLTKIPLKLYIKRPVLKKILEIRNTKNEMFLNGYLCADTRKYNSFETHLEIQ